MKNWMVTVTEHKTYGLEVEAATGEEAKEIAEEQFLIEFEPEDDFDVLDAIEIGEVDDTID